MKIYIGVKLIEAEPQTKDDKEGYKVVYPDGYVSWSPKQAFESAYVSTQAMTFGLAMEAMAMGYYVRPSDADIKYLLSFQPVQSSFPSKNPKYYIAVHHDENQPETIDGSWYPTANQILDRKWMIVNTISKQDLVKSK